MDFEENFESIKTEDELPARQKIIRDPIIKNSLARVSQSVTVKNASSSLDSNQIDFVQPIMQEQDIIGIIHNCSCGRSTEIMFEFDNPEDTSDISEDID